MTTSTYQKFNIYLPSGNNYKYTIDSNEIHYYTPISKNILHILRVNISKEELCEDFQVKLFKMGEEEEFKDFDIIDEEITLFALIKKIERFSSDKEYDYDVGDIIDERDDCEGKEHKIMIDGLCISECEKITTFDYHMSISIWGDFGNGDVAFRDAVRMDNNKCVEYFDISVSVCMDEVDDGDDDIDGDGYIYTIQQFCLYADGTFKIKHSDNNCYGSENDEADISI
jgi:hypothetical protein